jgi:DNA-binding IclR family transcriptional regulator
VQAEAPLTATALRKLCHIRNATLTTALTELVAAGRVRKDPTGYVISR